MPNGAVKKKKEIKASPSSHPNAKVDIIRMSDHVIVFYLKPTFKSQLSLLNSETQICLFVAGKEKKKKRGGGRRGLNCTL